MNTYQLYVWSHGANGYVPADPRTFDSVGAAQAYADRWFPISSPEVRRVKGVSLAKPTDIYTFLTERDDLWRYLHTHHPAEVYLHRELRENNPNALWRLLTLETDRHD